MLDDRIGVREHINAVLKPEPIVVPTTMNIRGQVIVLLKGGKSGNKVLHREVVENLIMTTGFKYYAELGAGETPTDNFTKMGLGNAGNVPAAGSDRDDITGIVSGSELAFDATYPKTNDTGDGENTGDGPNTVSFRRTWAAGVATDSAIDRVFIVDDAATTASDLLMYATISSVNKTASDSLKIFVNHAFA
jgi:hypothetical protein